MSNTYNPLDMYEIKEQIGAGGGGSVYRCFHKNLQTDVVLKKVHSHITDKSQRRAEVDILKNLHHSYLPTVYDCFEYEGDSYTVMNYISGKSFGGMLKEGKKFSQAELLKYTRQLSEAVAYLHSQKIPIIHGDIKPDNIMLTPEGDICLIDFNISSVTQDGKATVTGFSRGYTAPEIIESYLAAVNQNKKVKSTVNNINSGSNISADDKTEILDDDKTELLENDKTEVLVNSSSDDRTVLMDNDSTVLLDDDRTVSIIDELDDEKTVSLFDSNPAPIVKKIESSNHDDAPSILVDKAADIFSIGATLFHIYTGTQYSSENTTLLDSRTSEGFVYILNKCLNNSPDKRYKDGAELLKAINNVHSYDKRYKSMMARQNLIIIVLCILIAGGIFSIVEGKRIYAQELDSEYDNYILELNEYRESLSGDAFNETYCKAIELFPDKLDAYYQKALYNFQTRQYEENITYIENTILTLPNIYIQENLCDVYYILGESYMELDYYDDAYKSLQNAIKYNSGNANYYVDEAICLARLNEPDKAIEVLKQATDRGVADEMVYLINAEIDKSSGNYQSALDNCKEVFTHSSDNYVLYRAYVLYAKCARNMSDNMNTIDDCIAVLKEGNRVLPLEYHGEILEMLAQYYIDGAIVSGDSSYNNGAIDSLETIIDNGWGSITTYNNLIILYQKIGNYNKASNYLALMEDSYHDDYRVYKRKAFLELDIQKNLSDSEKDFSEFKELYDKASELYNQQNVNNAFDSEMQILSESYNELVDKNWL